MHIVPSTYAPFEVLRVIHEVLGGFWSCMNTPTKLPDILIGKPRLPRSRFHREALASYHGISYADVFTQYGKLLEGVEVVGFSDAGCAPGCFEVMFQLQNGQHVFFHYFNSFWKNLQELRDMGIDVEKYFCRKNQAGSTSGD